jgi:hypothetical protein
MHCLTTVAILALGLAGHASAAVFVDDPNASSDGTKLFLTKAKDASSSTGTVVAPNDVNISVVGPSDFSNGFSTIKPVKGGSLTELTFTPVNPNEFDSFSFRGQAMKAETLDVIIQDNEGDPAQTLTFSIAKANQDFGRDGIISTNGGTIKSVEIFLPDGFEEGKQFEFDLAGVIPEPATWALMLAGVGGLGAVLRSRRGAARSAA